MYICTYTVKRSPWLLNTCCRCAYLLGGVDPYVTVSSELIAACIDPPPPNTPASDLSGVDKCTSSLDLNVLQLVPLLADDKLRIQDNLLKILKVSACMCCVPLVPFLSVHVYCVWDCVQGGVPEPESGLQH